MVGRMTRRLAVLAAAMLAFPAAASATTRYVDDDHAQCRHADASTVQAALDASRRGDTVQVCGGFYREDVVVPAGVLLKSATDGVELWSAELGDASRLQGFYVLDVV